MNIDLIFLFLMYAFSSIALLVSIYALWTLKEVEEYYKTKRRTPNISHTKVASKARHTWPPK